MDLNGIFKFGSKVDVLLSAYKSQTIGNKTLVDGEPFIKLSNVAVDFSYDKENTTVNNNYENYLSKNSETPSSIRIEGIPLNEKITSLLYTQKNDNTVYKTNQETVDCENNTIVLSYNDNIDIFIYDVNKELKLQLTNAGNIITNDILTDDKYTVFYKHKTTSGYSFALKSPHISYLTIEIFGIGNINEENNEIYLRFLRCALNSSAKSTIDFNNTTNTVSLSFEVLDGKNTDENIMYIG